MGDASKAHIRTTRAATPFAADKSWTEHGGGWCACNCWSLPCGERVVEGWSSGTADKHRRRRLSQLFYKPGGRCFVPCCQMRRLHHALGRQVVSSRYSRLHMMQPRSLFDAQAAGLVARRRTLLRIRSTERHLSHISFHHTLPSHR